MGKLDLISSRERAATYLLEGFLMKFSDVCRVRRSHSDTALSGLDPERAGQPPVLKADGQSAKHAVLPQAGAATQPEADAAPQVSLCAQVFGRLHLLLLMYKVSSRRVLCVFDLVPKVTSELNVTFLLWWLLDGQCPSHVQES